MKEKSHLAARDISANSEQVESIHIPASTGNPILDANLYDIAHRFSGGHSPDCILQLLSTVMNAASSPLGEHDLQIMNRSLAELYHADMLFHPYEHTIKVTCFGSARIKKGSPAYSIAHDFAKLAIEAGTMVITGGGPGIMEAANEGAGRENSFGLNITLPFEQHPNPIVDGSNKMMDFYYFFTRKLNLVKQTDALVAFPGGFGTMDEIYESITLIQTGKSIIFPIVLIDPPGDQFWTRWMNFVKKELVEEGLISHDDMDFIYLTKSAVDAVAHIEKFYSRYHSYIYEGNGITIRIKEPLPKSTLSLIRDEYSDILPNGITQLMHDEQDCDCNLCDLPRLKGQFTPGNYARLRQLIDEIND